MYEIKEFYGADTIDYKKLCAVMFRGANEDLKNPEEYKVILEEQDKKRDKDFFRLGAFYENKLYAGIECYPYMVYFDKNICKMSGIGGVISDFNSPMSGALKQIYTRAFELMREKGQYISHLYPFEESYYRRYGYDVSCESAVWHIPVEKLTVFSKGKNVYYDGSLKMQNDIKDIFEKFASDKNMMILNSEKEWEEFFKNRIPYMGRNMYVHYNEENIADAFMEYKPVYNEERPQDMSVETLWYTSFAGLKGVLSYFETQKSYCDKVIIKLPESVDISAFVNSTGGWGKRNIHRIINNAGQSRVVDVEKILEIADIKGEGKASIKIVGDTYAPWNNECFTVEFGKERRITKGSEADIEMSINAFSSGIFGRYGLADLEMFDGVKINSNKEELEKIFYKKHIYTEGHF